MSRGRRQRQRTIDSDGHNGLGSGQQRKMAGRLVQQRQAKYDRRSAEELGLDALRFNSAAAPRHDEPEDRVGGAEEQAERCRDEPVFGDRAQQVRAAKNQQYPADMRRCRCREAVALRRRGALFRFSLALRLLAFQRGQSSFYGNDPCFEVGDFSTH